MEMNADKWLNGGVPATQVAVWAGHSVNGCKVRASSLSPRPSVWLASRRAARRSSARTSRISEWCRVRAEPAPPEALRPPAASAAHPGAIPWRRPGRRGQLHGPKREAGPSHTGWAPHLQSQMLMIQMSGGFSDDHPPARLDPSPSLWRSRRPNVEEHCRHDCCSGQAHFVPGARVGNPGCEVTPPWRYKPTFVLRARSRTAGPVKRYPWARPPRGQMRRRDGAHGARSAPRRGPRRYTAT